jgi:hypothetical protein
MTIKKQNILLFAAVIGTAVFSSCGGEKKSENSDDISLVDTSSVSTSTIAETFYQVPSPGEMLSFIKQVGGKNNKNVNFLNKVDNQKQYTDQKLKALNFGIYSCDLSYCSVFEIGTEALKYFKTLKELGDQIGVSSAVKPENLKRLQDNIGNSDSLALITDELYFASFEKLEGSKQGPTLSLVVAGGWIESLFIVTNLAKYETKSVVVERVCDQKYTLDNLIEFLRKYKTEESVASVLVKFEELQSEFSKIEEKDADTLEVKDNTKRILSGGKNLIATAEQYKHIVDKVKIIRNSFTLTK